MCVAVLKYAMHCCLARSIVVLPLDCHERVCSGYQHRPWEDAIPHYIFATDIDATMCTCTPVLQVLLKAGWLPDLLGYHQHYLSLIPYLIIDIIHYTHHYTHQAM